MASPTHVGCPLCVPTHHSLAVLARWPISSSFSRDTLWGWFCFMKILGLNNKKWKEKQSHSPSRVRTYMRTFIKHISMYPYWGGGITVAIGMKYRTMTKLINLAISECRTRAPHGPWWHGSHCVELSPPTNPGVGTVRGKGLLETFTLPLPHFSGDHSFLCAVLNLETFSNNIDVGPESSGCVHGNPVITKFCAYY